MYFANYNNKEESKNYMFFVFICIIIFFHWMIFRWVKALEKMFCAVHALCVFCFTIANTIHETYSYHFFIVWNSARLSVRKLFLTTPLKQLVQSIQTCTEMITKFSCAYRKHFPVHWFLSELWSLFIFIFF
jgi:hypothetical protein